MILIVSIPTVSPLGVSGVTQFTRDTFSICEKKSNVKRTYGVINLLFSSGRFACQQRLKMWVRAVGARVILQTIREPPAVFKDVQFYAWAVGLDEVYTSFTVYIYFGGGTKGLKSQTTFRASSWVRLRWLRR